MCNQMVTSEIRKSIRFVKIIIISRVSEISPKTEDIIHQIHRPYAKTGCLYIILLFVCK